MRSSRPKPLHLLCGRPMVIHVLDSLMGVEVDRVVLVVGHHAEWVMKELNEIAPKKLDLHYVEQLVQNGTGDAVSIALSSLPEELSDDADDADVLILPGDIPLLEPSTVEALLEQHRTSEAAATVLTVELDDPTGYGRIVRDRHEKVRRVVEQSDATAEERAIREVNTSVYCFRTALLGPALRRITDSNVQGEYYLTDVVQVLADAGHRVETLLAPDAAPAVGVNDRAQLASAEVELRRRINEQWMRSGVTMIDPVHTYVDVSVQLASDVSLHPGTRLQGNTSIAHGAEIGPDTQLIDCVVDEGASVSRTVATRATIGSHARVGPFVVLHPGVEVAPGQVIGPFTEITRDKG
jgi:bifunctional UDP-N-acetylglucosamine pyrophosphorylase / glucosamine-1-phosphate N-acetyltransferase